MREDEDDATHVNSGLAKETVTATEEDIAATRLQAAIRGHKERKKKRGGRKHKHGSNEKSSAEPSPRLEEEPDAEDIAATQLQAAFRGHKARKKKRGQRQRQHDKHQSSDKGSAETNPLITAEIIAASQIAISSVLVAAAENILAEEDSKAVEI